MDVLSAEALAFLAAAALLLALARVPRARLGLLVVANLAFLAIAHWAAPLVFLATTVGAWALARAAARGVAGPAFAALALPFIALLFLPKTGLLGEAPGAAGLSGFAAAFAKSPAFFVGSSYFTLRALHLVFDGRRESKDPPPLLETLAWNGFFPTIVAGPIERSQHF